MRKMAGPLVDQAGKAGVLGESAGDSCELREALRAGPPSASMADDTSVVLVNMTQKKASVSTRSKNVAMRPGGVIEVKAATRNRFLAEE